MNHQTLKDKMFALYDGELSGKELQEAQAHLASCQECGRAYAQWQRTAKTFFRVPEVEESEAFVHRVMERLEALNEPKPSRAWVTWSFPSRWFVPAMAVALLFILALGGVVAPNPSPVSLETLLLSGEEENVLPTTDQLFGFIMEDNS